MMDAPAGPTTEVEPPADDTGLAPIMEMLQKLQAMIAAKMSTEGGAPPVDLPPEGAEEAAPPMAEGAAPGGGIADVLAKLKAKRSGPPAVAA